MVHWVKLDDVATLDVGRDDLTVASGRYVAEAVQEYRGPIPARGAVAEAGCGGGLCSSVFATLGEALVGVEPSPSLAAQAKARLSDGRSTYGDVIVAELVPYFREHKGAYDLVVSAEALCGFASLEAPLEAMADALRPPGLVAFTLNYAEASTDGPDILPEGPGAFRHTETYVRSALRQVGLAAKLVHPVTVGWPAASVKRLLVLAKKRR